MDSSNAQQIFQCRFCSKEVNSKGGLSKHIKVYHAETKEEGKISCHINAQISKFFGRIVGMGKLQNVDNKLVGHYNDNTTVKMEGPHSNR